VKNHSSKSPNLCIYKSSVAIQGGIGRIPAS
jgi:hypothetical protein